MIWCDFYHFWIPFCIICTLSKFYRRYERSHFCSIFTFFQSFIPPSHSSEEGKKLRFCSTFTFSSHLIPTKSNFEIILHLCSTLTFPIIHPTQSHQQQKHKPFRISFWYWSIDMPKKSEGGWSGIGMANSGIHPTHVLFLNDHPTQIPPSEILGPVVQNCQDTWFHFFITF